MVPWIVGKPALQVFCKFMSNVLQYEQPWNAGLPHWAQDTSSRMWNSVSDESMTPYWGIPSPHQAPPSNYMVRSQPRAIAGAGHAFLFCCFGSRAVPVDHTGGQQQASQR